MGSTHSATGTSKFKKWLIKSTIALMVVGGAVPLSPAPSHAAAFSINNTDSYGLAYQRIYQFDSSNPGSAPAAVIPLTNVPSNVNIYNGLAISQKENVFYAFADDGNLYRIDATGSVTIEASLLGDANNAVISPDGTKYYYSYVQNGEVFLGSYDLITKQQNATKLTGYYVNATDVGGDLVIDRDGYLWVAGNSVDYIAEIDPNTGRKLLQIPISNSDGRAVEGGVRGLSFLPDGQMLISSGAAGTPPTFFTLSPDTLATTYRGSITGPLVYDLASRVVPQFTPKVNNGSPTVPNYNVDTTNDSVATGVVKGTDPDGDKLMYEEGQNPGHGQVTVNPDGTWVYTPDPGYVGEDSFTVVVDDGKGGKTESTITVNVTAPRNPTPPGVCGPRVALINGSFEEPVNNRPFPDPTAPHGVYSLVHEDEVPGWKTTASDHLLQIERYENGNVNISRAHGNQFAELNATEASTLYQDVKTTPGQVIYWRLAHRGALGIDTMQVKIGAVNIPITDLKIVAEISTGNQDWKYYSGTYTVPAGQEMTRFAFESVDVAGGSQTVGNFLDDIFLGTDPCGVVTKSASPVDNVQEGDILTYTVNFRNDGGDDSSNTVFADNIPEGTEYVPGSLEIVSGPNAGQLTDASGDDQGEFIANENRVVVRLGNGANGNQAGRIPNVDVLPDGTTVQFKVKTLSEYKTTTVANQATVEYDNMLSGNHETRKSNDVTVDVNRPPIAPDFEETTWKNTTVSGSVYGVDGNGDSLTFTKGGDPTNGSVTVNPDGTWTYVPDPDFTGTDSFEITVSDGKGGTSTSTVTVNVNEPPNQPPVTKNYDATTQKDTSVTGSVYGSDPDGDTLTYDLESDPKHGTVVVNPDGTWEYVPDPGYVGPDIFTVTVNDGKGGVTTSTVTVDVTDKPNNPPVSSGKEVTTDKGTSVTGDVYGTDPDGDPLTYTPGKLPGNGKLIVNPDGSWTYTPDPDFVGEDSFTVIVEDGRGGKTEVEIIVEVTEPTTPPPTNQPPVSPDKEVTTDKGTSVTGDVYGTDPDGDPLTYTPGKQPGNGTVIVNPDGSWTYTPDPDFVGEDSFTVIVDDGKGGKTEVTVTVRVTEPNTPPTNPGDGTNPTDPGNGTNPTDPGNGTNPTNPGNGTNPTDPGNGTNPTDPGNGMNPTNPGNGTNPTDPGNGTNPTDPGNGTNPTNPGNGTNPTNPGNGTKPGDSGDGAGQSDSAQNNNEVTAGESTGLPSPADQSGKPQGSKLPNTSTNVYNLGLLGMIILLAGFLLWRRRNV